MPNGMEAVRSDGAKAAGSGECLRRQSGRESLSNREGDARHLLSGLDPLSLEQSPSSSRLLL